MAVCGDKVCEAKTSPCCESLVPSICGNRGLLFPALCKGQMKVSVCGENELYAVECEDTQREAKLSVSVSASASGSALNDIVSIVFSISNTGNVTIHDYVLSSDFTDNEWTEALLGVGETKTYEVEHPITEEDILNGSIVIDARGSGVADGQTLTASSETSVPVDAPNPKIDLSLAGHTTGSTYVEVVFNVTNTGNVTLTDVELNIPLTGEQFTLSSLGVDSGDNLFEVRYACTPADYPVTIEGYARGVASNGATVTSFCEYTFNVQPIE